MSRVIIGVIAGVVLVVSVVAIVLQARAPRLPQPPSRDWYYDLNTRKLFSAPAGQTPPVAAPSGTLKDGSPAGVRAHVFGCGDCSETKSYTGYLETYSPDMKQRLSALREQDRSKERPRGGDEISMVDAMVDTELRMGMASMVKRPDDPDWVSIKSGDGQRIVQEAQRRCGEKAVAKPCSPSK